MKDVVRANTLTSRAQSELHLFGPFFGWDNSPLTAGWLSRLRVMADELRQSPSQEDVQRVRHFRGSVPTARPLPCSGSPGRAWRRP